MHREHENESYNANGVWNPVLIEIPRHTAYLFNTQPGPRSRVLGEGL